MATLQQKAVLHRQGRIDLAIQAHKQGRVKSFRAAAIAYDVPQRTAIRRVAGVKPKLGSIAPNRRLTVGEEESLKQWILSMDQRGMPSKNMTIWQMASILAAQCTTESSTVLLVGQNWVRNFINHHDSLRSQFNRKYDYQHAKYEDPVLIRGWFKCIQDIKIQYRILDEDTWNFDETGFQIGVIATAKVVTGTDRAGRPRTIQPGNQEWITIIECINAMEGSISPLVIFEAVMH
jgi:hypothetical protein